MPKLRAPVFPSKSTCITEPFSVELRPDKWVVYFNSLSPMFQHEESDLPTFRMFTSMLIDMGEVRQADVVKVFGVPLPTVKRYLKRLRVEGTQAFFAVPKTRAAAVLKGDLLQTVERLLAEGHT